MASLAVGGSRDTRGKGFPCQLSNGNAVTLPNVHNYGGIRVIPCMGHLEWRCIWAFRSKLITSDLVITWLKYVDEDGMNVHCAGIEEFLRKQSEYWCWKLALSVWLCERLHCVSEKAANIIPPFRGEHEIHQKFYASVRSKFLYTSPNKIQIPFNPISSHSFLMNLSVVHISWLVLGVHAIHSAELKQL